MSETKDTQSPEEKLSAVLLELFDSLSKASTLADMNIAAGIAKEDLAA